MSLAPVPVPPAEALKRELELLNESRVLEGKKKISCNVIARMINAAHDIRVSKSTISRVLTGKYTGPKGDVYRRYITEVLSPFLPAAHRTCTEASLPVAGEAAPSPLALGKPSSGGHSPARRMRIKANGWIIYRGREYYAGIVFARDFVTVHREGDNGTVRVRGLAVDRVLRPLDSTCCQIHPELR